MAWYDEAVFYHIYPLGMLGCPHENDHFEPVHRLRELFEEIPIIKEMGFNAIYIGPLFESVGHGYETTDYKKLDSRLGTNEDLTDFVSCCHKAGIKVILDGVFNHTGREFFAFKDIKENRENSRYLGWYSGVNLGGNNSFNDGFSYNNWGGYDLLVKLNQQNPEVQGYIADVIRFWVSEFDIDGLRLDAADVLDFGFMQMLRRIGEEVKPDFYLMGEVIHGEYIRWERDANIHAVTNYHLGKALYSGHNDHNYFEIAHTVKRLYDMGGGDPLGLRLYNFADNHDVERIASKLQNKAHLFPIYILVYTLPGVPSVYYGSEFGIEGRKGGGDDWAIRPAIDLKEHKDDIENNNLTRLISVLGKVRQSTPALSYGHYEQSVLTNRQYAYTRILDDNVAAVCVNNDEAGAHIDIHVPAGKYKAVLSGKEVDAKDGCISFDCAPASGEVFVKEGSGSSSVDTPVVQEVFVEKTTPEGKEKAETEARSEAEVKSGAEETSGAWKEAQINPEKKTEEVKVSSPKTDDKAGAVTKQEKKAAVKGTIEPVMSAKPYEDMTVEELQSAILYKMSQNGPLTDEMRKSVSDNIWRDSLLNWVKSFG